TVGLLGNGITAEIDVLPTQLDFGQLDIGQTASMDLEIRNLGTADLELGLLFLDGSAEFSLDLDPSSQVLTPGDSTFATVSYTPADLVPDTGELQVPSNDLDEPLVAVPLLGAHDPIADIHVDPQLLDFGAVDVGQSVTETVTVHNQGTGDLWVDEPTLAGDAEFDLDTGGFPCTLGPGESASLPVTYAPVDGTDDNATITVDSDDPDEPSVQVALTGAPTPEPGIYVMPPSLSFGQVQIGDSASLNASITSVGNGDLELGSLAIVGSAEFSLITDPSGQTLAPGAWTVVEVSYAPVDAGSDTAQLEVPSNDADEPLVTIELSGAEDPVPDIEVDPLDVDFGVVDQGLTASETVQVGNVGTATLTVTGISLAGSGDFGWSAVGIPGALSPGDGATLTVTYTPSDLVPDAGTLTLTSTDPDEAIVTISLAGAATPEPAIELDPAPYDFGAVTLTCEETVDVAIRSVGGAPRTLTGDSLVESAPGGSMTLDVGDLQDYVDFGWELPPGGEIE
ncbi:MAG: choice-of-anchor D domain-containing protein, partial [Myxococcota bacterium]|nr:choice-of-anchor D domain-containing protein [Myxococcota bacterium]